MQNLSGGTRFKCYPGPFSSVSYTPESVEKKKQIYISDFVAVFGRFPEGWAQEELESANGTEVAPAPEEFISPETDGAVNMDDPAV